MKSKIRLARFDSHRLRRAVAERKHARRLGARLHFAHKLRAGPIGHRPLGQDIEIATHRQAGVVLDVIDAPEHLGRDNTAVE